MFGICVISKHVLFYSAEKYKALVVVKLKPVLKRKYLVILLFSHYKNLWTTNSMSSRTQTEKSGANSITDNCLGSPNIYVMFMYSFPGRLFR